MDCTPRRYRSLPTLCLVEIQDVDNAVEDVVVRVPGELVARQCAGQHPDADDPGIAGSKNVDDRVTGSEHGSDIRRIGHLYTQPATSFVATFVGLSNPVDGVLAGGAVSIFGTQLPLLGTGPADGAVTAHIRPEDIEFGADGIPATVVASSFLGSLRRTQVRLADGTLLFVQHDVRVRPVTGEAVSIRLTGRPVAVSARIA